MITKEVSIKVRLRKDVKAADLRSYIIDAVECWGGGKDPADPLFDSVQRVTVLKIKTLQKK